MKSKKALMHIFPFHGWGVEKAAQGCGEELLIEY